VGLVYEPVDLEREAFEDLRGFIEKLLSKPAPGSAGRTGLYRPAVDAGRCIKCGICWLYCPDDVISWAPKGLTIIDYSYCKGCGICSSVCPVKAIDMVLEGE